MDEKPSGFRVLLSCFVSALAVMSFLCGGWLSAAFTFGFGLGDTWVFYPPRVTALQWLTAFLLVGFSVCWFLWTVKVQERITRGQAIAILVVFAILVVIVAPLAIRPAWKG